MLSFFGLSCDERKAAVNAASIFLKIECGGKTSWLFGTMHAPNPVFEKLPGSVKTAIAESAIFLSEIEPDEKNQLEVMRGMLLQETENLEHKIGKQRFDRLKAATDKMLPPMSQSQLDRQKIWAASLLVAWPRKSTDAIPVDILLYEKAKIAGCKTAGIESPAEQIAALDKFTEAEQIQLLEEALEEAENDYKLLNSLMDKYIAQDLNGMAEDFFSKNSCYSPELKEKFINILLIGRNKLFLERVLPEIRRNNVFIAVGAGHLIGAEGLVSMLEKEGCRVTPVKIEWEVRKF
ncbi:MAG: TraB/GumN family protein [Victivallales bacterium]